MQSGAMEKGIDAVAGMTGNPLNREGKYLTFGLGNEVYGVEILEVREIIGIMHITAVPQTPRFVKGVINLRGRVMPVVDLKLKFGMEPVVPTERTCIIVVEIEREAGQTLIGIMVDSISEVLKIKSGDIEDPFHYGDPLSSDYIPGIAKTAGGIKILLDINRVIGNEEIMLMERAA